MPRRAERGLLVTALGLGLAGGALVVVAAGATLEAGPSARPELTFTKLLGVWLQLAAAGLLCHAVLCVRRPRSDQLLLPVSLALTGLGLAVVFSLDPAAAQKQVGWVQLSLVLFLATVLNGRRLDDLRSYRYLLGLFTLGLLLLPMLIGKEINGARLWIRLGSLTMQPGELAKVGLVLFMAAYLHSRGDSLVHDRWQLGPLNLPSPAVLAPLIGMWAVGMVLLVALRDLGTALLFYGTFVVMLFLATAKPGYLAVGAASFAAGAAACAKVFHHVQARVQIWLDPWSVAEGKGYQVVQGLFAIAAGGLTGVGLGHGAAASIPEAATDYPFASICEELGLAGAAVVVALYLIWVYRAYRIALRQPDGFRSLLAAGLGTLMATQTLVILGGVTKLIPLTGITLPFISYGGSSLLTNFLMLGLLLHAGDEAAR